MGVIKIQDSGYIKPTNEGTQAASANRANSGSAITLHTVEFIPIISRNVANEPELGSATPSEVNLGSIENMQFSMICKLKISDDTHTSTIQHLLDCVATNGYKFLWYDYTSATAEKNNGQLIYRIAQNSKFGHQFTNGEKTAFTVSDNFYHLHVHILEFQPRHLASSGLLTFALKGIVTKVETSQI